MARLVINPGTPQAREFELKPGDNYLGRGFANDFKIEDPSVSTSHAQIIVNGDYVLVKDLGSTNGTFVNRTPVTDTALQPGQWLRLGGVEMLFEAGTGASPAAYGTPAQQPAIATIPEASEFRSASPAMVVVAAPVAPAAPAVSAPSLSGGGLRLAGASHAAVATPPPAPATGVPPIAPAVAAPPMAPAIPPPGRAIDAAKKSVCRYHPKSPARWSCPQCGQLYCDLCVGTRKAAEGIGYFCRPCGVQCTSVGLGVHVEASKIGSFYSMLPGAFAFPFKHGGWMVLICGTLFLGFVDFLRSAAKFGGIFLIVRTLALQIIFLGYMFAYMQNVIQVTARGDESEASLPDISNFVEDILVPCLQLLGTVLFCFAPVFGVLVWTFNGGGEVAGTAMLPAIILGILYFPMGFLAVAMFDTVTALNPMLVVPSITKVWLQYLIACALLGSVFLVRWLGATVLNVTFDLMAGDAAFASLIRVIPSMISSFIGLYFLTVQCRILGLLYYTNKPKLGWFKR